jgi:hypothetical protein
MSTYGWLSDFAEWAGVGEAHEKTYFWAGVSTLAATLGRRIWIEQATFQWYPNLYVVLVSPPGVISKSTLIRLSHSLLKQVPGVQIGQHSGTWQGLLKNMEQVQGKFEWRNRTFAEASLVVGAAELGNFLTFGDQEQIDALVEFFDCAPDFRRGYKNEAHIVVQGPCLNFFGGTTEAWLTTNVGPQMLKGGLVSRMVFVHDPLKAKLVPYSVPSPEWRGQQESLASRLVTYRDLVGAVRLSPEALAWGSQWYAMHWQHASESESGLVEGVYARGQTLLHKLALVLMVAKRADMIIQVEDLAQAAVWLEGAKADAISVFNSINVHERSKAQLLVEEALQRIGRISRRELFKMVQTRVGSWKDYEEALNGIIRSGTGVLIPKGADPLIEWLGSTGQPGLGSGA